MSDRQNEIFSEWRMISYSTFMFIWISTRQREQRWTEKSWSLKLRENYCQSNFVVTSGRLLIIFTVLSVKVCDSEVIFYSWSLQQWTWDKTCLKTGINKGSSLILWFPGWFKDVKTVSPAKHCEANGRNIFCFYRWTHQVSQAEVISCLNRTFPMLWLQLQSFYWTNPLFFSVQPRFCGSEQHMQVWLTNTSFQIISYTMFYSIIMMTSAVTKARALCWHHW